MRVVGERVVAPIMEVGVAGREVMANDVGEVVTVTDDSVGGVGVRRRFEVTVDASEDDSVVRMGDLQS